MVEDRLTRLAKWKAERERRKKANEVTKKRPFVVGVVHHKLDSPFNNNETFALPASTTPTVVPVTPVKRVTRATEKRLKSKAHMKETAKIPVKHLTVPTVPKIPIKHVTVTKKVPNTQKEPDQSFAPANHKFQAPVGLNHMPLFGRVAIHSMSPGRMSEIMSISRSSMGHKKNITTEPIAEDLNDSKHLSQDPVFFSPYVVASRGKSNARKEEKIRRGFSLGCSPNNDIPTKETVMKNLNISVDEEERTAQYFIFLLNRESEKLNDLCKEWMEIKEEPGTTEDGQYEINQAIGQTNLLISKKFERFRRLVADCETGEGQMLVTCKDLQGFWDMMYMEVKNCNLRFEKLEKLRSQGWVEEEVPVNKPVVKKKAAAKKKVAPAKSSSIRAFLAEKKKKMTEGTKRCDGTEETDVIHISNNKSEKREESPGAKYKMRRSISIGPGDNRSTPVKFGKRLSLLQKVQLSETSKKIKSPLTVMKVSQMCKTPEVQVDEIISYVNSDRTPEVQLDETISYVNSDQTPAKSILKQPKDTNQAEMRAKSVNKVNFDDHIDLMEVPVDEETQIRIDLGTALARIDHLSFDNIEEEVPINAERKLVFDDQSSDESETEDDIHFELENSTTECLTEIPVIKIETATPVPQVELIKRPSTPSPRRTLRRQNAVDEDDVSLQLSPPRHIISTPFKEIPDNKGESHEYNESIRVLRNRTITAADTPKAKRRSSRSMSVNVHESEQKENETPSSRRRNKSSLKLNTDTDGKMDLSTGVGNLRIEESMNKRRSTRSVKFSGMYFFSFSFYTRN